MKNYNYLLGEINRLERNQLIIGPAGCGKSHLIKQMQSMRDDIIAVAPSGIAALNIGGSTIQSYFGITPYTYTTNKKTIRINNRQKIEDILRCKILLIDEISMIRCEILDIVDCKLRHIRKNPLPFGGLKLLFIGDPFQMEPVVQCFEKRHLEKYYPENKGDYNFYNARVLIANNFFNISFDIFRLDHDYRHKDDPVFRDMLAEIRLGKISVKNLNLLNSRYKEPPFFEEGCQYLTKTHAQAKIINDWFTGRLKGKKHLSRSEFVRHIADSGHDMPHIKCPFQDELRLGENMKIMFVKNDLYITGHRWVNGTMGTIKRVNVTPMSNIIASVDVDINGKTIRVEREPHIIRCPGDAGEETFDAATVTQFPFIPSWAITIDKSQGLTLDKIALDLERGNRPNQIYVALSRARKLEDVILAGRKLRASDIHCSPAMKAFMDNLSGRIVPIDNNEENEDKKAKRVVVVKKKNTSKAKIAV
jgi:hypothetical protein